MCGTEIWRTSGNVCTWKVFKISLELSVGMLLFTVIRLLWTVPIKPVYTLSFRVAVLIYIPYRVLCYNALAKLRSLLLPIVINMDVGDTD